MSYSKLCQPIILFSVWFGAASMLGQQAAKATHSWDVLMGAPEARDAAKKLLGHCGDAETQDVMNACFALEFKNADQQMNLSYQATLKRLDGADRERVRVAQRAWLRYLELHCQAVGSLQAGGGSLEPTEVFSCKAELTKTRTKEIQSDYKTVE